MMKARAGTGYECIFHNLHNLYNLMQISLSFFRFVLLREMKDGVNVNRGCSKESIYPSRDYVTPLEYKADFELIRAAGLLTIR